MATKKKTAKKAARKAVKPTAKAKKPVVKAKAKAKAKAKPKAKPAKQAAPKLSGFAGLAKWKKTPLEDAGFDFMEATNESVDYGDCFPEEPEHLMVHTGNVKIAGPLALDGHRAPKDAQQTVYIIDGDLEIDGSLVFDQADILTTLWVTGNMKVQRIALMSTAMLVVGGALDVSDILVTDLEDAGHLIVHGALSAQTWIDLSQGRGCIELGEQPQARLLSDYFAAQAPRERDAEETHSPSSLASAPATSAILPALLNGERPDDRKIVEAIRANAPILA